MTTTVPLRGAAEVVLGRQRSPQHSEGPHMMRYLRAANVQDGELDLNDVQRMNFSPSEQQTFALQVGDVLVTEGSGSLRSVGASAVWRGEIDGTVCFQNTLLRLRPRSGVDGRYLGWWARSSFASGVFASIASGANIYHLSAERVRGLAIELPPLDEQRRIADFLDAETRKIAQLSERYREAGDLVVEREQCIIDRLIDADDCPLVPLRYLVTLREGPGIMAYDFADQGVPLIRLAGMQHGSVTLAGCNHLDPGLVAARFERFKLRLGDYVISGSATMGEVSVVNDERVVGAVPYTGLIILRPISDRVNMRYVASALRSSLFRCQIDDLKTGATMQHFGPTHLAQVKIPQPGIEMQGQIAQEIESERRQAEALASKIRRQRLLLTERSQALITAAVTGGIDVTTARGVGVA